MRLVPLVHTMPRVASLLLRRAPQAARAGESATTAHRMPAAVRACGCAWRGARLAAGAARDPCAPPAVRTGPRRAGGYSSGGARRTETGRRLASPARTPRARHARALHPPAMLLVPRPPRREPAVRCSVAAPAGNSATAAQVAPGAAACWCVIPAAAAVRGADGGSAASCVCVDPVHVCACDRPLTRAHPRPELECAKARARSLYLATIYTLPCVPRGCACIHERMHTCTLTAGGRARERAWGRRRASVPLPPWLGRRARWSCCWPCR